MSPALKPVAFILGVPRSGTTLLRVMLAGHPRLFSPPEMVLAHFETMQQRKQRLGERFWEKGGLRRALIELRGLDVEAAKRAEEELTDKTVPEVYAYLQHLIGDRMLVDKCPHLCASREALDRLTRWFPQARYLWIIRHPGSVIRSIENMPYAEVMLQGYRFDSRDVWYRGNQIIEEFLGTQDGSHWTRIVYEDLVREPRPIMERACDVLGVSFHAATLDPYQGERMRDGPKGARAVGDPNMASRGRIDPDLATSWLEGFDPASVGAETIAMAKRYGYDLDALPPSPIRKVTDALGGLLEACRTIEASIRVPMDLDAVEARRFLLRLLAAAVDTFVERGDTDRPRFTHAEAPHRKMLADCPDADYLRAPIQLKDGTVYRVWGRIPARAAYVGVCLYHKGGRVGASLHDHELRPDPAGRFEVLVAAQPPPSHHGVWLAGGVDATAVIVRQYFTDRGRQQPIEIAIERVGDLAPAAPLTAEGLAEQIERAQKMVRSVFRRTVEAYRFASVMALNRFVDVPTDGLFPTPDNTYRAAWFRLGPDQLMLIRGVLPRASYFGLCLYNAWLESYDYTRHRIHLNHEQLQLDRDGRFEVCLAHRDIGHSNWLDTAGHRAGYVVARSLLIEGDPPALDTEILYEREWKAGRQ